MASITKTVDAAGAAVSKSRYPAGVAARVKRSLCPQAGLKARTIERELNKLPLNWKMGVLPAEQLNTKRKMEEAARLAALESAKLKTLR